MSRRICIFFSFILTLLLFISCGTPVIIDFTDAIIGPGTGTLNDTEISAEFSIDENEFVGVSKNDLDAASPALLLLYNISDTYSVRSSSFISKFASEVKGSNFFGYPISNIDDGICEINVSSSNSSLSGTYKLFPALISNNTNIQDPTYTFSRSDGVLDFFSSKDPYTFTINAEQDTDDANKYNLTLYITDTDGNDITEQKISRVGLNDFFTFLGSDNSLNNDDYSIYKTNGSLLDGISINFYMAINLRGNFSNIFWSKLYYIGSIQL